MPGGSLEPDTKLSLTLGQTAAVAAFVLVHIASLGGVYLHMDRRLTTVETRLDVLSVERVKTTDDLSRNLTNLREDIRELRTDVKALMLREAQDSPK